MLADDELLGGDFDAEVPAPDSPRRPAAVAAEPKPQPFLHRPPPKTLKP